MGVLDPDVVLRADTGRRATSRLAHGAAAVANNALMFSRPTATLRPALVNGATGVIVMMGDHAAAVMAFTVAAGRIVAIDALNDPDRLRRLDLSALD